MDFCFVQRKKCCSLLQTVNLSFSPLLLSFLFPFPQLLISLPPHLRRHFYLDFENETGCTLLPGSGFEDETVAGYLQSPSYDVLVLPSYHAPDRGHASFALIGNVYLSSSDFLHRRRLHPYPVVHDLPLFFYDLYPSSFDGHDLGSYCDYSSFSAFHVGDCPYHLCHHPDPSPDCDQKRKTHDFVFFRACRDHGRDHVINCGCGCGYGSSFFDCVYRRVYDRGRVLCHVCCRSNGARPFFARLFDSAYRYLSCFRC
mmetsp:Transcript_3483/g.5258  ORF Transcript_3483/g.5258 Transcript_3483/m.5258 type:complete len:256 (-) Transcript_3483:639-1406(-)